jgi:excinuclease ABC subunit A
VKIVEGEKLFFSTASVCIACDIRLPSLTRNFISFNGPQGTCQNCSGIGTVEYFELELLASNKGSGLRLGAVIPLRKPSIFSRYDQGLSARGLEHGFTLDTDL